MPAAANLKGWVVGRLVVERLISKAEQVERFGKVWKSRVWECYCRCGATRKVIVEARFLKKGTTWHCGCVVARKSPDWYNTPEHRAWQSIKGRCFSPTHQAYKNYGGRGITLFEEWRKDFPAFLAHVGLRPSDRHSIERIHNDKGYVPGNVTWATSKEQNRNRRSNRYLTLGEETKTLAEWAEDLGVNQSTVSERLSAGWPLERALKEKLRKEELLTYKGVSKTKAGWAEYLGLTIEAFTFRIAGGWPPDRLFQPKMKSIWGFGRKARKLEFQGKSLTVSEWAQELNIPITTIKYRLAAGRGIEDVLSVLPLAANLKAKSDD